ncbi:MAG: hypothetical protein Q8K68_01215, partial [Nitrospirota bacterium]|nr:hypothetical protein [Nitrospirota bacterium]
DYAAHPISEKRRKHYMRSIASFFIIISSLLLSSCAATLPIAYTPSNLVSGTGSVSVERFYYTSARKGNIAPNQPEKNPAGMGDIYLSDDIETLFTDAVRKELRFSGYKLAESVPISIAGTIDRFYYDWVGLLTVSVDIVVTFRVGQEGKVIFSQTYTSHKEAPKEPGYEIEAIKSAISECIQYFLQEAVAKGIL